MAIQKHDPFSIGDYNTYMSQYQNWTPVRLPNGQVYYEIPGNPGYVFIPEASKGSGNVVIRPNPKDSLAKQQEEEDALKKAQKHQEFNQSPIGQILPVATGTAGIIAASKLAQSGPTASNILPNGSVLMSDGTIKGAQGISQSANAATQGATGTGSAVANSGNLVQIDAPIAGAPTGSFLTEAPSNFSGGQALAAAAAVHGGIGAFNDWQHGRSGRAGLTEGGAGIGTMFAGPLGGVAGAAIGNSIGYGLQGSGWKNNLALAPLTGGVSLIPGVGDVIRGGLIHTGTKQNQNNIINELRTQSDDPNYRDSLEKAATQSQSGSYLTDKSGVTHNKWEDVVAAGVDPNNLVDSIGNLQTYGTKWSSLTPAQKLAVTQANINSNLYDPNLGIVEITDKDTAQSNFDKVVGGAVSPSSTTTPAQAAAQGALGDNSRTITRSPGILANGHHIVYGR